MDKWAISKKNARKKLWKASKWNRGLFLHIKTIYKDNSTDSWKLILVHSNKRSSSVLRFPIHEPLSLHVYLTERKKSAREEAKQRNILCSSNPSSSLLPPPSPFYSITLLNYLHFSWEAMCKCIPVKDRIRTSHTIEKIWKKKEFRGKWSHLAYVKHDDIRTIQ